METTAALSELERVQTQILQRISDLELLAGITQSPSVSDGGDGATSKVNFSGTTTEARLSNLLLENGVKDFKFKRVSFDYYDWSLETRRDVVGAASIHHLCKSIVLVNTQAPSSITDCSNRNMSKYYVVVVQYTARFNAETVKNFLYSLNDGKIPKKKFNLRLAPEESSRMLTGYEHNGVTCIGMKTDIPVILDEAIVKLNPDFFWLGGGEIDLKLGIRTSEFINYLNPFIVSCSSS
ncbi:putative ybaK/aminoacyl-tRNA synthetase-associated domain-containing protein [Heracleum sosnowskyi]|uniref:YbaK/aminoacyl-tRNA synthetase-associated domain-containing protein n=1 Tax=Heracleum sosnowskyi TaxID=360622 RepID=A0AAD8I5I9_9APIA|nr:putative ybaK/aminoacyl-tRNA synthetase-associated domain-containing protein [Heracleum sosnowskyi]